MNNYNVIMKKTQVLDKVLVNQGFNLTFDNGVYVSVKFGTGTYSDEGKTTAEIAVIDSDENWYVFNGKELEKFSEGSEVNARMTTNDLVEILYLAKQL